MLNVEERKKQGASLLLISIVFMLAACNHATGPLASPASSIKEKTSANTIVVVPVTSGLLHRTFELPAELKPYRDVEIHSKVKGFVSWMGVDRGSLVKSGQVLIKLTAPELDAQCDEAGSKVAEAKAASAEALANLESDRASLVESKAKLDSDTLTLERLRKAAREPGAIAQNEIDTAQKTMEGDAARLKAAESKIVATKAVVAAKQEAAKAAQHSLASLQGMRSYLTIRAPFDGMISERWAHEGDIAGVEHGRGEEAKPLLRLIQPSLLRLIVSVPEQVTAGIRPGDRLTFAVPAYLGKQFSGTVMRVGHALDVHTRTMPVELDVKNEKGELEPGMYATVKWQFKHPDAALSVPASAVASNLEKTFVDRIKDGVVEPVEVRTGQTIGDMVQIVGDIKAGDNVVLIASDELKRGSKVTTRLATAKEIALACRKQSSAGGE